jgi:phage tail P2-like protein
MADNTILPQQLSEIELNLDAAASRISDVSIPIATLWSAKNCSIEVLPYLAWAFSVDDWRNDWPEQTKRQVVIDSPDVHSKKGTRPAVQKAISSVYGNSKIIEWFEQQPQGTPGTFLVDAFVSDEGIDQRTITTLSRQIDNSKRKSAHYTLRVVAESQGDVATAAANMQSNLITVDYYTLTELTSSGQSYISAANLIANAITVESIQ